MNTYKIIVTKDAKPWCEIFINGGPGSDNVLSDSFSSRFPLSEGFSLQYMKAKGERRLLESSPEGLRVISREPIFELHNIDFIK